MTVFYPDSVNEKNGEINRPFEVTSTELRTKKNFKIKSITSTYAI
jgi:hypothetical protein